MLRKLLVVPLCFLLALNAATPPQRYAVRSDTAAVTMNALSVPVIGTAYFDPDFDNVEMLRVTGPNTAVGTSSTYQNRSFSVPSGSEQNSWNSNTTRFLISMAGGVSVPWSFDPVNMTASRLCPSLLSYNGLILFQANVDGSEWSYTNPDKLYQIRSTLAKVRRFNFDTYLPGCGSETGGYSDVIDINSIVPGIATSGGGFHITSDDLKMTFYFGGGQDTTAAKGFYVERATVDSTTHSHSRVIDFVNKTITTNGGAPVTVSPALPSNLVIHNMAIDKDGTGIIITINETGGGSTYDNTIWYWKLSDDTVNRITGDAGSHKAQGFNGYILNTDQTAGNNSLYPQLQRRNASALGTPTALIAVDPGVGTSAEKHISWNNARSGTLVPTIGSTAGANTSAPSSDPMVDEIIGFTTDLGAGVNIRYRFAYTRNYNTGDNFTYQVRGTVSQCGRYFMYASDFRRELGLDNGGVAYRNDVFIVRLNTIGVTTASSSSGGTITYDLPNGAQNCTWTMDTEFSQATPLQTVNTTAASGTVLFDAGPSDTVLYGRAVCGTDDIRNFTWNSLPGLPASALPSLVIKLINYLHIGTEPTEVVGAVGTTKVVQ
jgi:hypothetical protein